MIAETEEDTSFLPRPATPRNSCQRIAHDLPLPPRRFSGAILLRPHIDFGFMIASPCIDSTLNGAQEDLKRGGVTKAMRFLLSPPGKAWKRMRFV